eukprot:CAMPEP_0204897896 /NCGR_PEP_ID=MMETSP1397-20131031/983_1 /ASSEMBLY_ACC=CAM_ASM_000891 /TAXON_ID=49980 /ORGANISM="Climacostomum Climacostomum virens, Strain Stock W-24" /LENGTH=403 /DNA_ID=CAMNT_0052065679 /DNA_START=183 /DNA_END=1391 /DNA_ORIENTATION=+
MRRGRPYLRRKAGISKSQARKKTWQTLSNLVLQKVALYAVSSVDDYLVIASVCRAWHEGVTQSQLFWLHLNLSFYPKRIPKLAEAKVLYENESPGTFDWRNLFVSSHKALQSIKRDKTKEKVLKLMESSSLSVTLYKPTAIALSISVQVGKQWALKTSKDVFFMDNSLCVRHILEPPASTLPTLSFKLSNLRYELQATKSSLLGSGDEFNLLQNSSSALSVTYPSGEAVFIAWNLHYAQVLSKLANYKPRVKVTDHDSTFGMLGYYLITEVRTGGSSMARGCFRSVDFESIGNCAESTIDTSREGMKLKEDFGFTWQSSAFTQKFKDIAVFDITLKSSEGEPIWCISQAAALQRDSIDPTESYFEVCDINGKARFDLKKLTVKSISLKLNMSFLGSIFVKRIV